MINVLLSASDKLLVFIIYCSLGKFSRRQIDDMLLFYKKIGFDISCILSQLEKI